MITREKIARWLFPDIAKNAARYCVMRNQIRTEIWWLAEFPDVRDTLQRLLDSDLNYWRALDEPHIGDQPDDISDFREMLRLRDVSQTGGRAHPLAKRGSPDAPRPGLYRVVWKSGGSSLAAIGILSNGDRWIAPTNWITPGTMPSAGEWADIERLDPIDVDELSRVKDELARVLTANFRQASCIHQCAAAIGPDTVATIDGLPRAVKHLVEQLNAMTAERDLLQDILDARPAINAGLPDSYVRWSQSIYSGDAVRAMVKAQGNA